MTSAGFSKWETVSSPRTGLPPRPPPRRGTGWVPIFNAQACASCHVLDGRGDLPDPSGAETRLGLLLRISIPGNDPVTGGPLPDPVYGDQLQDRSVIGVPAEGTLTVTYAYIVGTYGDGTEYELRTPTYEVTNPAFGPLPDDVLTSPRLAPQVIGVGLLEAIPAESILAGADPGDADGDGISGRANMVWNARTGTQTLGRVRMEGKCGDRGAAGGGRLPWRHRDHLGPAPRRKLHRRATGLLRFSPWRHA